MSYSKKQQPRHTSGCSRISEVVRVSRRVNSPGPFSHIGVLLKCTECGRLGKNPVRKRKGEK